MHGLASINQVHVEQRSDYIHTSVTPPHMHEYTLHECMGRL